MNGFFGSSEVKGFDNPEKIFQHEGCVDRKKPAATKLKPFEGEIDINELDKPIVFDSRFSQSDLDELDKPIV